MHEKIEIVTLPAGQGGRQQQVPPKVSIIAQLEP